jgi:hypothetical protein
MQITIDEAAIQTTIDTGKLQALMRQRSGKPPEGEGTGSQPRSMSCTCCGWCLARPSSDCGGPQVYKGKVVRSPMTVTRVKRRRADLSEGSAHFVEAEIDFDDLPSIPYMLEPEARVVFL